MSRPGPTARSVVGAAVVGLLLTIGFLTTAGAQASSYTPTSYAARLLSLVNDAREMHGLDPLALAPGTTEVAAGWTQHLADAHALSHNPQLARQLETHGSSTWRTYGENVGVGSDEDPDGLFRAYMLSPEHRANILTSAYGYVGVAVLFTGSRAWNTFDFVDVYGTTPAQHSARRQTQARPGARTQHASAAVVTRAPRSVAAAQATVSTPSVRPTPRAPRPAGPVVVHVEALHRQMPRSHVVTYVAPVHARMASVHARIAPAHTRTWSGRLVATVGHVPGSRSTPMVLAVAVMALCFVVRRWVLVVTRRVA